ncbi:hypothetical protein FHX73_12687 [Kitasatospora viridis]|uniref:Uncharacterized protein n=1 Tax=Kitasatospora viridis TaxID=281105 RepID=A0A561TWS9_9ACTN|nr:hypothetical protein FHX73_12687 [Kitasatospora viridis]
MVSGVAAAGEVMLSDQVPTVPTSGRFTDWVAWMQTPSRPAFGRPTSETAAGLLPAFTVVMTVPRPFGAATVVELRVNGTAVSDRFAASAPSVIAIAMAVIATAAGTATRALRRQRVTPRGGATARPARRFGVLWGAFLGSLLHGSLRRSSRLRRGGG